LLLMQLFLQQLQQSVRPHYLDGKTINGRMRAILVDWLVQVHSRFQLLQETLYMCVAVMDRFLQVSHKDVDRRVFRPGDMVNNYGFKGI